MKPSIPHRDHQIGIFDGQGAGQVNGVCAPEGMKTCQSACLPLYRRGEFDRSDGRPELLPSLFRHGQVVVVEVVIPSGSRESGSNFRVRDPARKCCVTAIPQIDCEFGTRLFDYKFDEGAGIEIDERHGSAPLLADYVRHWVPGSRP
ncbi:MAG TPA: hypothetical protein VND67_03835 [Acidimicrobiales bacterium]|nr:hypothetical protein [Acidimicrobiales bacterium]